MSFDLQVVPPPNNDTWAEVFLWQAIAKTVPAFNALANHLTTSREYSPVSLSRAMRSFNDEVELFLADDNHRLPRQLLFTEAYTAQPTHLRYAQNFLNEDNRVERMAALVHGGSFIPGDQMSDAAERTEGMMLRQYDVTIAPTQWAADLQTERWHVPVQVAPWPLAPDVHKAQLDLPRREGRLHLMVNPHRLVEQKGIKLWSEVERMVNPPFRGSLVSARGTLRQPESRTRGDYLSLLRASKAVFANSEWETFGIAVMEALALGCCPVLNHHPVYDELYSDARVHWHDGTPGSVAANLVEVMDCDIRHYKLSALDSMKRVLGIAAIAAGEEMEA